MYSNLFGVPIENAFSNLENYHQQWTGQNFAKKTGFQAVWDSLKLNFVSAEYNRLSKELAKTGGNDPHLLKAVEEHEQRVNQLRDRAPKFWQDEYVKQGGWDDVGQAIRSVGTMLAENAGHIVSGMATAALAGTGMGLFAGAARLAPAVSRLLVAGASRAGIAGSTYNSTWGIKYREMTNEGIPHDIALNFSRTDALLEGLIEGGLGGVEAAGARAVIPQAVRNATNRMFISGKMSLAARGVLNWLKQGVEEGSEELLQGISSGDQFNRAVDAINSRREKELYKLTEMPFNELRKEIYDTILENNPEVNKKEWGNILDEAFDGAIGGFLTGIILGIPIEITNFRNDTKSATMLAGMAQNASSKEELREQVNRLKEQGLEIPLLEGMKTDEVNAHLDKLYDVQQSRLTPEQREEKRKQAEEAEELAELTDYSNARITERIEKDKESGEEISYLELTSPDKEDRGNTGFDHYTTEKEDGSIDGRFVLGDTTKIKKNQYGYINYTERDGTITIDDFEMLHGYKDLRQELFDQFSADPNIRGKEIIWNVPEGLQHVKEQLINNNRRGPKFGLTYHEQGSEPVISNDARIIARQFKQHMNPNTAPMEVALAAEVFNAFYKRRGESVGGAMNRLLGNITNDPKAHSQIESVAQTAGNRIKGATWLDQTAEGLRNFIYLNKNSADPSSVVHELGHIVEKDFTEAERRIAARALNGYELKNGTVVYFDENNNQWTDEQHEAFAEALENYLTNGKAPNEQIKPLLEKIKEFMKRIYKFFTGWTELSPQVEDFYKSLMSGELVEQARKEEAQRQKENVTDEAAQLREEIINDPTIPLEDKTEAVFNAAGDALFQLTDDDQAHSPTAALLERARRIPDLVERQRAMDEIRRLRGLYAGTEAEFKAPNGKDSLLLDSLGEEKGREAWYAVRTEGFKKWFGDWEAIDILNQLEQRTRIEINEPTEEISDLMEKYKNDVEGWRNEIASWAKKILPDVIKDPYGKDVNVTRSNIKDALSHGKGPLKVLTLPLLEEMLNNGVLYHTEKSQDKQGRIIRYFNYAYPIQFENISHVVTIVVKEDYNGKRFYDNEFIEETDRLPLGTDPSTRGSLTHPSRSNILRNILSVNPDSVSKVVDENGEPKVVYHGTPNRFDIFDRDKGELNDAGWSGEGHYFYGDINESFGYKRGSGVIMNVFLNVREPYYISTEERDDLMDRDDREYSIRFSEDLKSEGYDGVYYNGDLRQEWTVFKSEQIKSATDNTGTYDPQNPSILFQLSNENQEIVNAAKAVYGTTNDIREAGYLIVDGTMLDFSGKNDGGLAGKRALDHREMDYFEYNGKVYKPGKWNFIAQGNIRLMPEIGGINLAQLPNDAQVISLKRYIQYFNGETIIDFVNENGDNVYSIEYNRGTKSTRILNDIKNYYEKGIVPEQPLLFQIGDVELIKEAAGMENGLQFMNWLKFMGESYYPQDLIDTWNAQEDRSYKHMNEATIAWCEAFVQYSKQAVAASEKIDAITGEITEETTSKEKATPAELDHEFLQLINRKGKLENFTKVIAGIIHEGSFDEKSEKVIDTINRKLKHRTWQTVINAKGRIGENVQRKQLLTLIRKAPRDYRAIYAEVMEREDLTVSQEDTTAEALRYRIKDSRAEGIGNLTPEKLRQLSETLDREDFAEKVRTGKAKFDDPAEKAYIKWLQEQVSKAENALEELQAEKQEDDNYIEKQISKEFNDKFNNVLALRETIGNINDKLERALRTGQKDASDIARNLRKEKATYDSLVEDLKRLARTHQLEIDVMEILNNQRIREAVKAARTETIEKQKAKLDEVLEEFKEYRKSAKTEATLLQRLARKAARQELQAHINEMNQQREKTKELTRVKKAVIKRIFKKPNPQEVNAEQGIAIAVIQDFAEPSFYKGINAFIGEIVEHDLPVAFRRWKIEARFRSELLRGKPSVTQDKMRSLFEKENLEDLTEDDKKYLARKIAPEDWVAELGLKEIAERRRNDYPMTEEQKQLIHKYLPSDVVYRIMDKPFSQWTLNEAEELAKIIDDLAVRGKNIRKANVEADRKRIRAYQQAVIGTIKTVKPGTGAEEAEKILGKYDEGVEGTAQSSALRRKLKGPLFSYSDMNIYRYTRMLDNDTVNGANQAALYRAASDAYNQEKSAVDARTERITKLMKDLKITETELWEKTPEINLGEGEREHHQFTRAELLGFISATRDDYSRHAVMFGNLLSEQERVKYHDGEVTEEELTLLKDKAGERFARVQAAAQKLIEENPHYQKLLDAIEEDFTAGGKRLSEALVRYNNNFMPMVEHYFPMMREAMPNSRAADAKTARELMGSAGGAFSLYVEKGFTKGRIEIPAQYQTAINLDLLGVWTESVNKEEHFIAYGQLVKDLNQIYKQNRQVRDTIQRRYGRAAVNYIDKYISELANPRTEGTKPELDKIIRAVRGNTAAAYLSWKTSSIVKQFITSPAPFFAYMNPIEYWGTFIDFITHKDLWNEIIELSPHMKHRSTNLMTELVKEQAKQQFDNKALAAISKFNKKGMEGLELIDRVCVAPGWLALFRKEHKRLTNENKLSEQDIRLKAAQYADDITRLTQPSSRADDLSPLFKGNNELGKAFLQFTQSLNVIWQNIRYDMPLMMREKKFSNYAGMIIGYTVAGVILGAITVGFDDDDDGKEIAKKLAFFATTQFTDAFPLIGSEATRFTELLLTGEMKYQSGMNLLPALDKGKNAAGNLVKGIQQKDFNKLLKASAQAVETAGLLTGLPVSGTKEFGRLFGIGDDDGEINFNPGALLGKPAKKK